MGQWEECLSRNGCRITAPRRAIIRILQDSKEPLSPQDIMERAEERGRQIGLVTIYRTIDLLDKLELVRRVHLPDDCQGYVLSSPGHNHVIVCQRCGDAVEFPGMDDLEHLVTRVEADTGYAVQDHWLQLFGLCPACQARLAGDQSSKSATTHKGVNML